MLLLWYSSTILKIKDESLESYGSGNIRGCECSLCYDFSTNFVLEKCGMLYAAVCRPHWFAVFQ